MWAGMVTRYRLGGPGIESQWLARFAAPVQNGPGVHQASYTMDPESFLGVKRRENGTGLTPHLEPKLKSRELYLLPLWGGLF